MRVLEVILNLVELLMDLGVLKQCLRDEAAASGQSGKMPSPASSKAKDQVPPSPNIDRAELQEQVSPHRLLMDIVLRYKSTYEVPSIINGN